MEVGARRKHVFRAHCSGKVVTRKLIRLRGCEKEFERELDPFEREFEKEFDPFEKD